MQIVLEIVLFAFIFLQLSEKNCTNSKQFRIATEVKKDEEDRVTILSPNFRDNINEKN